MAKEMRKRNDSHSDLCCFIDVNNEYNVMRRYSFLKKLLINCMENLAYVECMYNSQVCLVN